METLSSSGFDSGPAVWFGCFLCLPEPLDRDESSRASVIGRDASCPLPCAQLFPLSTILGHSGLSS